MKYTLIFTIIGFLSPAIIFSQNLEVEGNAVIKIMDHDNAATLVVVKQADGRLAVRDASTLTDGDADPTNEIQDLSINGDILTLTLNGSATEIDLSEYLDNTDAQKIDVFQLTDTQLFLSIEGDGEASKVLDLSTLQDGTGTDDQTLTEVLTENNDAGGLKITGLMDPAAAQDAATKAYVDAVQSDVDTNETDSDAAESTLQTNIDNEATRAQTAEAANATSISNHVTTDLDISATNELNSTVILDGTDLKVTDAGGTITTDLSSLTDGTGTDDQTLAEVLSENNDAGGVKITGLMDPAVAQDAATKAYVDQLLINFAIATIVDTTKTVQDLLSIGISTTDILATGIDSSYFIGLIHAGGIIFYMESDGTGLVSAESDQSTSAVWGCFPTALTGADETAIGTGNQNTIDIEAGCPDAGIAAEICANLILNGFDDWFLPSKDELNEMWSKIGRGATAPNTNIGNFANHMYWSSSEYDDYSAWRQDFLFFNQLPSVKASSSRVRAIRAF